jgi:hypothetical protein
MNAEQGFDLHPGAAQDITDMSLRIVLSPLDACAKIS